jgi:hypothetical protein
MRLRGVFDPVLPDTQERKTWRLSLQPRFGDITRNDHIRIPVGFIYGFNARTDGEIEFEGYLANPLEDGTGAGISNVRGTLKRLWTPGFDPTMKAAVGVGFECPIEGSPYWLVDGVNRYTTFVTFSRPSSKRLNMETFLNLTYEVLVPSSADGVIPYDRPQDDFVQITTGLLYRRDPFAYGLSLGWEHTVDGMPMDFYTITPSIIYDVPRRFSFKRPGRWQLGTAVEVRHWESETDVSVRLRVRWLSDSRRARSK